MSDSEDSTLANLAEATWGCSCDRCILERQARLILDLERKYGCRVITEADRKVEARRRSAIN